MADSVNLTDVKILTGPTVDAASRYVDSPEWMAKIEGFGQGYSNLTRDSILKDIENGVGPMAASSHLRQLATNIPPASSETLMRTLHNTSFRDSAVEMERKIGKYVNGKIRIATLNAQTCPACIALHGTAIPLGERVDDHYRGRCSEFYQVEGGDLYPDSMQADSIPGHRRFVKFTNGEDWFRSLPAERQKRQAVFAHSPKLYQVYKDGVPLSAFVGEHIDPVFGKQIISKSPMAKAPKPDVEKYFPMPIELEPIETRRDASLRMWYRDDATAKEAMKLSRHSTSSPAWDKEYTDLRDRLKKARKIELDELMDEYAEKEKMRAGLKGVEKVKLDLEDAAKRTTAHGGVPETYVEMRDRLWKEDSKKQAKEMLASKLKKGTPEYDAFLLKIRERDISAREVTLRTYFDPKTKIPHTPVTTTIDPADVPDLFPTTPATKIDDLDDLEDLLADATTTPTIPLAPEPPLVLPKKPTVTFPSVVSESSHLDAPVLDGGFFDDLNLTIRSGAGGTEKGWKQAVSEHIDRTYKGAFVDDVINPLAKPGTNWNSFNYRHMTIYFEDTLESRRAAINTLFEVELDIAETFPYTRRAIELLSTQNKQMFFTSIGNPDDALLTDLFTGKTFTSAAASNGHGQMTIFNNGSLTTKEIIHEYAHTFDTRYRELIPDDTTWDDLWVEFRSGTGKKFEKPVRAYGEMSIMEDFATSVETYIVDAVELRKVSPKRFAAVESYLEKFKVTDAIRKERDRYDDIILTKATRTLSEEDKKRALAAAMRRRAEAKAEVDKLAAIRKARAAAFEELRAKEAAIAAGKVAPPPTPKVKAPVKAAAPTTAKKDSFDALVDVTTPQKPPSDLIEQSFDFYDDRATDLADDIDEWRRAVDADIKKMSRKVDAFKRISIVEHNDMNVYAYRDIKVFYTGSSGRSAVLDTIEELELTRLNKTNTNDLLHQVTKEIVFVSEKSKDDAYWARLWSTPGFTSTSSGVDGTITVFNGEKLSMKLFAHEAGHMIYSEKRYTASALMEKLFDDFNNGVVGAEAPMTAYAKHNAAEDFAVSLSEYVTNYRKMFTKAEQRHNEIARIILELREDTTDAERLLSKQIGELRLAKKFMGAVTDEKAKEIFNLDADLNIKLTKLIRARRKDYTDMLEGLSDRERIKTKAILDKKIRLARKKEFNLSAEAKAAIEADKAKAAAAAKAAKKTPGGTASQYTNPKGQEVFESYKPPTVDKGKVRVHVKDSTKDLYDSAIRNSKIPSNTTLAQYEKMLENNLREMTENRTTMRIHQDSLYKVDKDGWFKTQFETHTSGGSLDNDGRAAAELKGMGVPKGIAARNRPIYGYIEDATMEESVSQYGDVKLFMSRDLDSRTTVTVGDSLFNFHHNTVTAVPKMAPTIEGMDNRVNSVIKKSMERWGGEYLEAQMHGQVGLGDVDALQYLGSNPLNARQFKALNDLANKYGILFIDDPNLPKSKRDKLIADHLKAKAAKR